MMSVLHDGFKSDAKIIYFIEDTNYKYTKLHAINQTYGFLNVYSPPPRKRGQ